MVPHLVDILVESSTATTAQKYSNGWLRWRAWALSKLGVSLLPAVLLQVALYLTEVVGHAVRNGHSVSVIESAAYSIRWGHRLAGLDSPTVHPLVNGAVDCARRKLARPVQPKQPLAHETIASITSSFNSASAS